MKSDKLYLEHIATAMEKSRPSPKLATRLFWQSSPYTMPPFVIGEAVKQLSNEAKDHQPDVPWRKIAGFRDILIHHYFGIDLDEVWRIIQNELPRLRDAIESLRGT